MSTDEYVPSEDDVRLIYVAAHVEQSEPITRRQQAQADRDGEEAWTAFLARVRRDAAREFVDRTLLDWGIGEDEDSDLGPATADDLRTAVDDTYPEETP